MISEVASRWHHSSLWFGPGIEASLSFCFSVCENRRWDQMICPAFSIWPWPLKCDWLNLYRVSNWWWRPQVAARTHGWMPHCPFRRTRGRAAEVGTKPCTLSLALPCLVWSLKDMSVLVIHIIESGPLSLPLSTEGIHVLASLEVFSYILFLLLDRIAENFCKNKTWSEVLAKIYRAEGVSTLNYLQLL